MSSVITATSRVPDSKIQQAVHHDFQLPVHESLLSTPIAFLDLQELKTTEIFSNHLNLRRDLQLFWDYANENPIKRSHRLNEIPQADCNRLAKVLGHRENWDKRFGDDYCWLNYISQIARTMNLVSFDTKGVYAGYSSQSASFPDNYIKCHVTAWNDYLSLSPLEKEHLLLDALIKLTRNEFFGAPSLIPGEGFDTSRSAIGPASKMNLPSIRRSLLGLLLNFKPGEWYDIKHLTKILHHAAPNLILDPQTCTPTHESECALQRWEQECTRLNWQQRAAYNKRTKTKQKTDEIKLPPKPELAYNDIYENFRELNPKTYDSRPIKSNMRNSFERVEGRYLEFFLREIPFNLGYIDLAYLPASDKTGLDVTPSCGRLRGFCLTERFFSILQKETAVDQVKTTVLPNFEIVVEALSYPDKELKALMASANLLKEEPPIYRLKLDRRKVVEAEANRSADTSESTQTLLAGLTGKPLPPNVAAELKSWSSHAEKVTFFSNCALVELRGSDEQNTDIETMLAEYTIDSRAKSFLIVKLPHRVLHQLQTDNCLPLRVVHNRDRLTECDGAMALPKSTTKVVKPNKPPAAPAEAVTVTAEDVICYRISNKKFMASLKTELADKIEGGILFCQNDLLFISASALPNFRTALRKLAGKFNVSQN